MDEIYIYICIGFRLIQSIYIALLVRLCDHIGYMSGALSLSDIWAHFVPSHDTIAQVGKYWVWRNGIRSRILLLLLVSKRFSCTEYLNLPQLRIDKTSLSQITAQELTSYEFSTPLV